MIVGLQASVEIQARKASDLEDYIDSMLMKVLSTAPQLLQKNNDTTPQRTPQKGRKSER